jgi:hypothetical protein
MGCKETSQLHRLKQNDKQTKSKETIVAHIISNHNYDLVFFDKLGKAAFPGISGDKFIGLRMGAKLGVVFKETVAEHALANRSKGRYKRTGLREDFTDLSDCKTAVSQRKNNNVKKGSWAHSICFPKVKDKRGGVRLIGWDQYNDEWYFLAVPREAYEHLNAPLELTLETYSSYAGVEPPWGSNSTNCKWLQYRLNSFTALATYEFQNEK